MNTFDCDTTYHTVDKDILFYINATEQDQWDNFILEDQI